MAENSRMQAHRNSATQFRKTSQSASLSPPRGEGEVCATFEGQPHAAPCDALTLAPFARHLKTRRRARTPSLTAAACLPTFCHPRKRRNSRPVLCLVLQQSNGKV